MVEQVAEGPIPDVVTLERIAPEPDGARSGVPIPSSSTESAVAVLDSPPKTRFNHDTDASLYAPDRRTLWFVM